jgi:hypothetical protein
MKRPGWLTLLLLAAPSAAAELTDEQLTALMKRHFGEVEIVGAMKQQFPRYLVGDINGDGTADMIAAFSDAESTKRGEGCYGLGIVHSYLDAEAIHTSRRTYNCFKAYSLESLRYIPLSAMSADILGAETQMNPSGPCVQTVLTHDYRNLLCWVSFAHGDGIHQRSGFYINLDSRYNKIEYHASVSPN